MAKFTPGPIASALSGSIGGTVFSHNRGGPYIRLRAIPVDPNTTAQQNRRADLSTLSQNWQDLTAAQRQAWLEWARQNPNTDSLGRQFTLSGQQAYISLNARIRLDAATLILVPPIIPAPDAFTSIVQDGDIGAGDTDLTFAAALETGNKVMLWGCIVNSAGIKYVKNLFKFIAFSAVDQASPWDNQTALTTILGTLTVGQTLHIRAGQYDPATGLVSPFLTTSVVLTTT